MKKELIKLPLLVATALMASVLISCGGGSSAESFANEAIAAAEEKAPLTEVPVFGAYRAMEDQEAEAKHFLREKVDGLKEETKDDHVKNMDILKKGLALIDSTYKKKFAEVADKIDGTEIKVEFNQNQISAASAKLKKSSSNRQFSFAFDITLVKPLANKHNMIQWKYFDANGQEIRSGMAMTLEDMGDLGEVTDSKVTVKCPTDPRVTNLDHLYVEFDGY